MKGDFNEVLPAQAGMILTNEEAARGIRSAPRAGGDDPDKLHAVNAPA